MPSLHSANKRVLGLLGLIQRYSGRGIILKIRSMDCCHHRQRFTPIRRGWRSEAPCDSAQQL